MFKLASQKRNPGLTRVPTRTITTLLVITLAVAAYAAVNFKSGPNFSIPISTFSLFTTGELSGLGGAAHVTVDAKGTADGSCTNKGGNLVPVQAATVGASGSQTVSPDGNGKANFMVTSNPVASPNPCPSGNWTFDITSVTYTSATVNVSTSGKQMLSDTFTLNGCTSDSTTNVSCTRTP